MNSKKIFALLLALALIMLCTVSAFADESSAASVSSVVPTSSVAQSNANSSATANQSVASKVQSKPATTSSRSGLGSEPEVNQSVEQWESTPYVSIGNEASGQTSFTGGQGKSKNIFDAAGTIKRWIWIPIVLVLACIAALVYVNGFYYKKKKKTGIVASKTPEDVKEDTTEDVTIDNDEDQR